MDIRDITEKENPRFCDRISLCGVEIDNITLEDAVARAMEVGQEPCFAVTPNAVILEKCRKDPACAALCNRATLSLADGAGVLLAAKRQGTPLCERVAGIDFGEALLARAAKDGLRVFLLGGKAGVANAAADQLSQRYAGLCVVGSCWGYFERDGEEDMRIRAAIAAARPDALLVCMGFPRQEQWIASHLHRFPTVRVAVGLGGAFDVWAGEKKRAPSVLSRMGLEWAWRMACEPSRLKNLPALIRFATLRNDAFDKQVSSNTKGQGR